jgi:integrase/recombinase XerD
MAEISLAAQGYCGMSVEPGKVVAASTFNQRRATLSSFYDFSSKRGFFLCGNPVAAIERARVDSYAYAQPLTAEHVKASMAAIDRTTKQGKRDAALLSILLSTGRRLTEVTQLIWGDVQLQGDKALVTFRCKGGKIKRDMLSVNVTAALLDWMRYMYLDLSKIDPATPLWISFTSKAASEGTARPALTIRSVSNVCKARLGTSKVHATRHTYAVILEDSGAKISDIQYELGHASLATTGKYLMALKSPTSKHGDTMSGIFGL